jgi:hypothetical protein
LGDITKNLETFSSDELVALGRRLLRAKSLEELGLRLVECG